MEMKEMLTREGRDAKNLLVYQFCDETSSNNEIHCVGVVNGDDGTTQSPTKTASRKPPVAPAKSPNSLNAPQTPRKCISPTTTARSHLNGMPSTGPRVRSASTGRDKKSELQARYWALLFGNLQRAVNEIYQTVECYENISSCQEAILVLENYVRDFKALSEWFKVSWDYESRPLQQRPQSLAWEVRKSNPAPRVRAKSLSSPTTSGKSSPALYIQCNSGKTSPSCDGLMSPRKMLRAYDQLPRGAMRVNVRELFASNKRSTQDKLETPICGEKQRVEASPIELEGRCHQYAQTDLEDDHLTLADLREKLKREAEEREALLRAQQIEEERRIAEREEAEKAEAEARRRAEEAEVERKAAEEKEAEVLRKVEEEQRKQKELEEFKKQQQNIEDEKQRNDLKKQEVTEETRSVQQPVKVKNTESPVINHDQKETIGSAESSQKSKAPTAVELTVRQLDAMETALLEEQALKPPTLPTNAVKPPAPVALTSSELTKKAPNQNAPPTSTAAATISQNSPLKYSSVLNRPVTIRTNTQKSTAPAFAAGAISTINGKSFKPTATNVTKTSASGLNGLRRTATTTNVNMRTAGYVRRVQPPPPRPTSKTENYGPPTNVATRLSARSRTMLEMNENNNANAKPLQKRTQPAATASAATARVNTAKPNSLKTTNDSRISSREDIGSSTSTLKASNDNIPAASAVRHQAAKPDDRHSEPKQLPSADANDGWLTVKTRRRSSMHWANRFNQPTGYASLPTLALLNEQLQQEQQRVEQDEAKRLSGAGVGTGTGSSAASTIAKSTISKLNTDKNANQATKASKKPIEKAMKQVVLRPEIKNAKAKVNSLPQRKNLANNAKNAMSASATSNKTPTTAPVASRQSIIKRQKSDLTGLKMTSLHKEYMRSEKYAQRKQQQQLINDGNNICSSTETVLEATINTSSCDADNAIDHNKIDIKIQTNREFSKTIGELYESISRNNYKLDKLSNGCVKHPNTMLSSCDEIDENDNDEERNERMLVEEQELLEAQIRELESTEIDVDTETDETDCEVVLEEQEDDGSNSEAALMDDASPAVVFVTMNDDENVSLELRYQALLSEMSWNERAEALATLQAYVARHPGRAQDLHQKLSSPSRRRSLHETLKKYQVKQARAQQKRELMQKDKSVKIQQLLARVEVVKSAKKQLIEDKRVKMEGRLQRAAENREQYLRSIVEKAHDEEKKLKEINFIKNIEAQNKRLDLIESSKETEGRLQDLEQERQKRLEEKAAKEAAVERRRQALEKERQLKLERLNETRLEKEQRIGKMQEQKEKQRQALAREKARDREERLLALQAQQQQTTEELQRKIQQKQLESARRHEENIEHIRQRALELTIPTRNSDEQRSEELDDALGSSAQVISEDCDLSSTVSDVGNGREHSRSYRKKMKKLKQRMAQCAGEYLNDMEPLPSHMKRESQVPKLLNLILKGGGPQGLDRTLGNLLRLLPKAQVNDFQSFLLLDGLGVIASNVITKGMEESSDITKKTVTLGVQLYRNACSVCPQIARHALLGNSITMLFDAIIKSMQLPEEKSPQHPVELSTELMLACTEALSSNYVKKNTHPKVPERLPDMISYAVLTGLIEILSRRCMKIRESIENHQSVMLSLLTTVGFLSRFIDVCPPGPTDTTRLLSAAKSTELFGTISMLYASVVPIGECIPKRTISLAASSFSLFVALASLDINTFQEIVSTETVSQKLMDVITIILNYCGNKQALEKNSESQTMVIDLIATLGFYCLNKRKNQDQLISESCSIILKSLTKLPDYFNPVIYPCLVTITFKNQSARNVIARDFNIELLDEYKKSAAAKKNHLIALIKDFS